jgi:hypothetical protein
VYTLLVFICVLIYMLLYVFLSLKRVLPGLSSLSPNDNITKVLSNCGAPLLELGGHENGDTTLLT